MTTSYHSLYTVQPRNEVTTFSNMLYHFQTRMLNCIVGW